MDVMEMKRNQKYGTEWSNEEIKVFYLPTKRFVAIKGKRANLIPRLRIPEDAVQKLNPLGIEMIFLDNCLFINRDQVFISYGIHEGELICIPVEETHGA